MPDVRRCSRCATIVMRMKKLPGKDAFGGPIWAAIPTKSCHVPIGQKPKNGDSSYYCNRCFNELNE